MLCFRKVLLAKKFLDQKGDGGVSKLSVENVSPRGAEKGRRGSL